MAHDVPGRAAAGDEQQRVDHDGLARAGLAGERGEAGPNSSSAVVDDHEIAQLKVGEHGHMSAYRAIAAACRKPPRPQRSLERSRR